MEGIQTREYSISFDELLEKFGIDYDKDTEEVWISDKSQYEGFIKIKILKEKLRNGN